MSDKLEEFKKKLEDLDDKYWVMIIASIILIPIIIILMVYLIERVKKNNQYKKINQEQGKNFKNEVKKIKNDYNSSPEAMQQEGFTQEMFNLNLNAKGISDIASMINSSH